MSVTCRNFYVEMWKCGNMISHVYTLSMLTLFHISTFPHILHIDVRVICLKGFSFRRDMTLSRLYFSESLYLRRRVRQTVMSNANTAISINGNSSSPREPN